VRVPIVNVEMLVKRAIRAAVLVVMVLVMLLLTCITGRRKCHGMSYCFT